MRTRLRSKVTLLFIVCAMLLAIPAIAFAQDLTGSTSPAPTIQSDKADYAPGELVTLTGSGWQAEESVHIYVNDSDGQTWDYNADVTADASGNISHSFNLPNRFVANYSVKATGASGAVATTTFTDKEKPSIAIQVSPPSPTTVGQSVEFKAILQRPLDSTVFADPSGSVDFSDQTPGAASLPASCKDVPLSFFPFIQATCTTSALTAGTHTIKVQYNGDDNFSTVNTSFGHTVNADTTAPTTTASAKKADNTNYASGDWTNQNVTVTLSATDNAGGAGGSGVKEIRYTTNGSDPTATTGTVYTGPIAVSSTTTLKYRAFDNANNAEAVKTFQVNIDKTKPVISATATVPDGDDDGTDPDPYTAGTWTNKDVTVSFSCTDSGGSGIDTNTVAGATKTASGADQSVTNTGTCTDKAGNTADSKTFNDIDIDKDKPVISATATVPDGDDDGTDPDPYTAGTWTNKDVTVSFSCTDALSGTDTNTVAGDTKTASGADQSVTNTGTCTDKAGNTADSKTFNDIDIDKDAPTIASSADRMDGTNVLGSYSQGTWTNKSVRVSFSCNDALSGVNTTASNIAGNTLTTEGENQSVSSTGSCVDQAGNTTSGASFSNIDIDKTAPTNIQFQFSGTPVLTNNQTYEFGSVPAGPTGCSANGDISGLKSPCSTDAASTYKTTVGTHTIKATAEDNAGNIGEATLVYTVDPWDATGFYSPVGTDNSKFLPAPDTLPTVNDTDVWNTVKGGSTVPLKFNVYAGSTEKTSTSDIQDLKATKLAKCAADGQTTTDVVDFTSTEQTSLRYSGTPGVDGQFIQNWKTPKVTGETCYRTAVTLDDGSSIYAFFKLLK